MFSFATNEHQQEHMHTNAIEQRHTQHDIPRARTHFFSPLCREALQNVGKREDANEPEFVVHNHQTMNLRPRNLLNNLCKSGLGVLFATVIERIVAFMTKKGTMDLI